MIKGFLNAFRENFGLKIFSAFAVVIVVSLSVYTTIAAVREHDKARANLVARGELYAGFLGQGAVVGIFAENAAMLKDASAGILGQNDVHSVSLYDGDGRLLYAGGRIAAPAAETGLRQQVAETADAFVFTRSVSRRSLPETEDALYLQGESRDPGGRVIGYARVVLGKGSYRREVAALVARNVVMMLFFIVASGALVWFAVKKVMRPLAALTVRVKALEQGAPVEPMPVETEDEIGKLAAAFNTMVAARTKAEESLRESEDRYRRLVELSPDAIYVQQGGEIVFINAAGVLLFGAADPGQVLGRRTADFVHQDDREAKARRFQQVEDAGVTIPLIRLRYLQMGGSVVHAEAAAAPFPQKGSRAALVIARDMSERRELEEKVLQYQQELYTAAAELSSLESRVEERERNLIAADLHDYVGQNLVVAQFKLGALRRHLAVPDLQRQLEEVRDLMGRTIDYTRSLTAELSPSVLVELGLAAAVESLAEGFRRNHGIAVMVRDDGLPKEAGDDTRYLLFRSVRECLMNVVKHARAKNVVISLERAEDGVRVKVADDGAGFDAEAAISAREGFGLYTIRDRMRRLGGGFEIVSLRGSGTTVVLTAPLGGEAKPGY